MSNQTAVAATGRLGSPGGSGAWTASAPTARVAPLVGALPYLLLPAALALWAVSVPDIDPARLDDLGLVSVLPAGVWAAFGLLCLSFTLTLVQAERRALLLTLHVLALVGMFYGIPALINDAPRGPIVFRHAGITESLVRTGEVDDTIDAYFNWPGLFMYLGSVTGLAGLPSAVSLGSWASVVLNASYLAPLYLLLRTLSQDARLVWGAVWAFYLVNWIDQDYLAPQGFAYLFYLTTLAVLVRWFQPDGPGDLSRVTARVRELLRMGWQEPEHREAAAARRTAPLLLLLVVLTYVATVSSHQLTPFAILAATTVLVVTGQCRATSLPLIMGVIVTAWFLFVAHGFIAGHLDTLLGDIGDVRQVAAKNIGHRVSGSSDHQLVVMARLGLSGLVWLLAGIGVVRRARAHRPDHLAITLLLAPVPLILITPYGGEMLLRIYFFMLPFAAFFAVAALVPAVRVGRRAGGQRLRGGAALVGCAALMLGVVAAGTTARYGNERMDTFTPDEVAAVDRLYELAAPRAVLGVAVEHLPWKYQDYELHEYVSAERIWNHEPDLTAADIVSRLEGLLAERPGRPQGYVILTASERVHAELIGGPSPADLDAFEQALGTSPRFRLVYENPDAKIYARVPGR